MASTKKGGGAAEGAKSKEDEQEQRIFVNNVRWQGSVLGLGSDSLICYSGEQ